MYTITERKKPYNVSIKVFNEAAQDRPAPWHSYTDGTITGWFTPNKGHPDLPFQMLNKVKCHGAKGAGISGRTSIRIAQDVFNDDRGAKIARRIKELHRRGCNIRLVYSQMVGPSRGILAGVPKNHLVADRDGDGAYDIYLHMKAMSISGNYSKDRGTRIVFNGSANWSGIGLIADENGLVIERDGVERQYGRQINKLFNIHLRSVPLDPEVQEESNAARSSTPTATWRGSPPVRRPAQRPGGVHRPPRADAGGLDLRLEVREVERVLLLQTAPG